MSIYRTNNPLKYAEIDGIVIDETAPEPSVKAVGSGTAIIVAQFQRGPKELISIGKNELYKKLGKSSFSGNIALKNKSFSKLNAIRVVADDAVKGTKPFDSGATPTIKFDAKYFGAYGNSIKVIIEAGSVSGSKYIVQDTSEDAVISDEIYDNVDIANVGNAFALSELVDVTVLDQGAEPDPVVATALALASDGTIADTDYEAALIHAEGEGSGNVVFLDEYNTIRNGYIKAHLALTQDKMGFCSGGENDSVATIKTDVALSRDTEGRVIYVHNWIKTIVNGIPTFVSPASFAASLFSQVGPHISLAYAGNSGLLWGVLGLKNNYSRTSHISLMQDGVSVFEYDSDIGFKMKSAVVTQIVNSSKHLILRRRMADFLTQSHGKFLKNFQNGVNSYQKRLAVKAAMINFIEDTLEKDGVLPKDAEVLGGDAKLVDIDSLNTDISIADGKFYINYRQRIYSSMRFIILKAEIGESVVVTEG